MKTLPFILAATFIASSATSACKQKITHQTQADTLKTPGNKQVTLPAPHATKSVTQYCKVIAWPNGKTPVAPNGFKVSLLADRLANPRNIYVAPNGDIFVSEANTEIKGIKKLGASIIGATKSENLGKSANRITMLRDVNGDGVIDQRYTFLSGLNQPYGMLVIGNWFYVANTDGVTRYPYKAGQTKMTAPGTKNIKPARRRLQ